MEELQELIGFISRNKIKQLEWIGSQGRKGKGASQIQELYNGISDGRFQTEEEVADHFFGGNPRKVQYARRLMQKLRTRLHNTLFFIDLNQPRFNDILQAYYQSHKDYAVFKILLGQNLTASSISLGEDILQRSLKYGFPYLTMELARNLMSQYRVSKIEKNKTQYYQRLMFEQFELYQAEIKTEAYFEELAVHFAQSRSSKPEMAKLAIQYSREVEDYLKRFRTYRLVLNGYRVLAMRYQIENDYENTIAISRKALSVIEKDPTLNTNTALVIFHFNILQSCILLRRFEEGEQAAQRCLALVPEGNTNWFFVLELHLMLAFHTNKFQKAYEVLRVALGHPGHKKLSEAIREQWTVYKAYVQYFISIGKIRSAGGKEQVQSFRIGKFLNEVPTFSKDKRGVNVSIIIIQTLFLLHKREFGQIIDRVEALNMYRHRYLRRDDMFRSNCFIQMLLQVPAANFNRIATVRRTQKFMDQLKEVPIETARQGGEIEVIPYETLWRFVLQSLELKPKTKRVEWANRKRGVLSDRPRRNEDGKQDTDE
ncbi:MAG: hypothetical protein H6563_04915 [Lewinellaceae bacterium]|nr:hypothetical protein [Lewinellaceae bacterium]